MSIKEFLSGFLGTNSIEIIASLSGFVCVYLLIKRNIWCFFFGFIQVSLYTHVFYAAKLYSDMILHIIYIGFQIYGWWHWTHNTNQHHQLVIEQGNSKHIFFWAAIAAIGTLLLGAYMSNYTDANLPYPDAFTTSTSLVAQLLLSRRYLFNWLFWIAVDVVAIVIYIQKGLYPTAILYTTFLVMCFFGYMSWIKQNQRQRVVMV